MPERPKSSPAANGSAPLGFEAKHTQLAAQRSQGADPEDPDEYRAASIFWVPKETRWAHLKASAPQPTIGDGREGQWHGDPGPAPARPAARG